MMKLLLKSGKPSAALIRELERIKKTMAAEAYAAAHTKKLQPLRDCHAGDTIAWFEPEFTGSWRNASLSGYKYFVGRVAKESYGATGQHTFTIDIGGPKPIRRKGRTIYGNAFLLSRTASKEEMSEKHQRGASAKRTALQNWLDSRTPDHPRYEDKRQRLAAMDVK